MPYDTFTWEGIDGTAINTYFLTAQDKHKGEAPARGATYNGNANPKMIAGTWNRYQQKYLSPRPETISARIGVNGYSPWTFACWRCPPPEIHLEQKGTILTKDNVPLQVAESKDNIAFVSLWDNFPSHIDIPVGKEGKAAVLLLCGTTNPMQSGGVENVRLTFCYEDGTVEEVPLRNPHELWSLCPLMAKPTSEEQDSINDYDYASSSFCLPKIPPETVQLGENCRAVALRWQLKEGVLLEKITVSAISKEIVFGVMAATIVK